MAWQSVYLPSRGPHAGIRLNYQHWTFKRILGGLIHPSIPTNGLASIADLGTGSAIWPIEVAEEFKATGRDANVIGFDISSNQFPAPSVLPSQVQLHVQDAFGTFEPEYHSKFDLVQIRAFIAFTRSAEAEKLLHNVSQILKPGGFLQWLDGDPYKTHIISPESAPASPIMESMLQQLRHPNPNEEPVFTFLPELPNLASAHGLQSLYYDSLPISEFDHTLSNHSMMTALQNSVLQGMLSEQPGAAPNLEMLNKLYDEMEAGSRVQASLFCFVAQKKGKDQVAVKSDCS